MIDPNILRSAWKHRLFFQTAKPFRNVVIDGFFKPEFAERLLNDFPKFKPQNAVNEFGEIGGKAVVTGIQQISPFYQKIYDYVLSPDFASAITALSGIPDLIVDPGLYGGGTHENLHGQELDPHVDFNYLESCGLHRRLNLLLYLNKEWEESWGGAIELHSNPRRPAENSIKSFLPLFNRCVLFETTERSWHGFLRVSLPEEKRHLSRKSISIYLYTKDRPSAETAPPHGTFYIPRPMPGHIRPGRVLTEEDVGTLDRLITQRDRFIEYYQNQGLARHSQENVLAIRLPVTGYAIQKERAKNHWADSWAGPGFEISLTPQKTVKKILLCGFTPKHWPDVIRVQVNIDGRPAGEFKLGRGAFEWGVLCRPSAARPFSLRVDSDRWVNPKRDGLGPDVRDLLMILTEIRCLH